MYQKVVSTGFLLHEQKALIIQRSMQETFLPGHYELPGGKVDFGEDPKEALVREYREEVNLQIEVRQPYHAFAYTSENGQRHTVEVLFQVRLTDPKQNQITLSTAHMNYQWITLAEIYHFPISIEIQNAIRLGFQFST